ncbi:MAG: xanthine dehydrogenase family protein subunit M [Chloroflexi bacterium]|nr:xanthine dehydrogenase family protein subunit M [Chloroflexota bacterium]
MRIDPFEYVRPQTVAEALSALEKAAPENTPLAENGRQAKIIAGGSDLLVRMKLGIVSPKYVVDIRHITDLKYIVDDDGGLRIGAGTSLSAVESSSLVRSRFPALATAAGQVASFQIRNAATIGGNICLETMCWYYNQSRQWKKSRPACNKADGETCYVVNKPNVCYATYRGDTAIALMALGARAKVQSAGQERNILLEDLFTGDGMKPFQLAPQEMITEIQVPAQGGRSGNSYCKVSHRNAVDYPQAGVGAALSLEPQNGKCASVRIVLGAVGSGPNRAREAEALLLGQEITTELLEWAAEAAMKDAHPVNNMTFGSPGYRRKMVKALAIKALSTALEQAQRG